MKSENPKVFAFQTLHLFLTEMFMGVDVIQQTFQYRIYTNRAYHMMEVDPHRIWVPLWTSKCERGAETPVGQHWLDVVGWRLDLNLARSSERIPYIIEACCGI